MCERKVETVLGFSLRKMKTIKTKKPRHYCHNSRRKKSEVWWRHQSVACVTRHGVADDIRTYTIQRRKTKEYTWRVLDSGHEIVNLHVPLQLRQFVSFFVIAALRARPTGDFRMSFQTQASIWRHVSEEGRKYREKFDENFEYRKIHRFVAGLQEPKQFFQTPIPAPEFAI